MPARVEPRHGRAASSGAAYRAKVQLMQVRVGIKDVADRAGVSISTVSRVLGGHEYVSESTRLKVLAAVEELEYRPDQVARSMRSRKTNLVALILSTIENVFSTALASSVEQAANERGYNLVICNTNEDQLRETQYLKTLDQHLIA